MAKIINQELKNRSWKFITYFSKIIIFEEIWYKIYNKELLAVI